MVVTGYGSSIYNQNYYNETEPTTGGPGPTVPPQYWRGLPIHGIMSSYFGDWEFDIGKSVRWLQYLTTDLYVMDTSIGDNTRNWVVAWDRTFPEAKYSFNSNFTFFEDPARWRRESFERAMEAYHYLPTDWVVFVDCTEGLCLDDDSAAPDANPFKWYLEQEAFLAGNLETVSFPIYAFLKNKTPLTHAPRIIDPVFEEQLLRQLDLLEEGPGTDDLRREVFGWQYVNRSFDVYGAPMYQFAGYSPRMFRVRQLLEPGFDWSIIDTFFPTAFPLDSPSNRTSIVSYSYARWAEDPADRDNETTMPLSASVDLGWRLRQTMNSVRAVSGLESTDWNDPDPEGSEGYLAVIGDEGVPFVNLRTPIYHGTFRDNVRDGLYYYDTVLGPVPWNQLRDMPAVDPTDWDNQVVQTV